MKSIKIKNSPIGFFDSGVGGLSVMKKTLEILPYENYIYFGDAKNAPYGVKSLEEVKQLTFKAVEFLIDKGVKAIVVACNTATSAAIEDLRSVYKDIPIVGIEPALKPAVEKHKKGTIIIMATPMTLAEKKFKNLMDKYGVNSDIVSLPCAGLVEFIEQGILSGDELNSFLYEKLNKYINNPISAIVLGCTHYPFVKDEILRVVGNEVDIIDGSEGTARELKRRLLEEDLLKDDNNKGKIEIYTSLQDEKIIELSKRLIEI
jgi:glutamate racemase